MFHQQVNLGGKSYFTSWLGPRITLDSFYLLTKWSRMQVFKTSVRTWPWQKNNVYENKTHCMPTFRFIHPHFTCLTPVYEWHTGIHEQMVQILT